jgi:hypothetical protein
MIVSSGAHVAPRAPSSRLASVIGGPPVIATFLSVMTPSRKPTHWPSGEMNGPRRPTPVAIATGSSASSARTKSCVPLFPT